MTVASAPVSLGAQRVRQLSVPGFGIADLSFPAGLTLESHDHALTTIAVVIAGGFHGWWNGRDAHCPPGTLLVEPAGERHANRFFEQAAARVVIVQPVREAPGLHEPTSRRVRRRPEARAIAWRIHQELLRPDEVTPMAVEGLALELSASAARDGGAPSPGPALIERAMDFVEERYWQPISLSDVALALDVHPGYLARAFRRSRGHSVGSYLREVRVRRAAERLRSDTDSLAEVALAVGFADQSHLTRWFVRHVGVTPARYRSMQQRG
jgi:AraC family transcriptional regulator